MARHAPTDGDYDGYVGNGEKLPDHAPTFGESVTDTMVNNNRVFKSFVGARRCRARLGCPARLEKDE